MQASVVPDFYLKHTEDGAACRLAVGTALPSPLQSQQIPAYTHTESTVSGLELILM